MEESTVVAIQCHMISEGKTILWIFITGIVHSSTVRVTVCPKVVFVVIRCHSYLARS